MIFIKPALISIQLYGIISINVYKKCLYGENEIDKSNMVKLSIDFGFIKGNTYLKRYGLSKINSWTYLVD